MREKASSRDCAGRLQPKLTYKNKLLLCQKRLRLSKLRPLGIGVAAEPHELFVEGPRLLPIARPLGCLRSTVESAVPVSCRLQGDLELLKSLRRFIHPKKQFS